MVSVLWLPNDYRNKENYDISFDENAGIEKYRLKKYLNNIKIDKIVIKELTKFEQMMAKKGNREDKVVRKEDSNKIIVELQQHDCDELDLNMNFSKYHLYHSWYQRLTSGNKSQLFLKLCERQGYSISHEYLDIKEKDEVNLTHVLKNYLIELEEHPLRTINEAIKNGGKYDDNYKHVAYENRKNNLLRSVKAKLNYLRIPEKHLKEDEEIQEILVKKNKFDNCMIA